MLGWEEPRRRTGGTVAMPGLRHDA